MPRQGEKLVTETTLSNRLRILENKISSILSFLVFIEAAEIKNFLIQGATDSFVSGGTAIVFDKPYKAGTTPLVLITSRSAGLVVTQNAAADATGFTGYGKNISDGSGGTANGTWIAIGERG